MTKQEEIREGMEEVISPYMIRGLYSGWDKAVLKYLHSQGVVIKVDDYLVTQFNSQNATVEPLID